MKMQFWHSAAFLLACSTVFVSCGNAVDPSKLKDPSAPVSVETIKPTITTELPNLKSFGSVSMKSKTDLSAGIDGVIENIPYDEGTRVAQGTKLVSISNVQLDVRYRQAISAITSAEAEAGLSKSRLADAGQQIEGRFLGLEKSKARIVQKQRELDRLVKTISNKQELLALDGVTNSELENLIIQRLSLETDLAGLKSDLLVESIGFRDEDLQREYKRVPENPAERKALITQLNTRSLAAELTVAEAKLSSAKAELDSVELLRKDLSIIAPYRAVVGARYLQPGERIQTGAKVLTIFGEGEVYATFPLQESEIREIRGGQVVKITVPALNNREYTGKITTISPVIDPNSGNLQLRVPILNTDTSLKPGMFILAQVITGNPRNIQRIPVSAIAEKSGNNASIFTVNNHRLFMLKIEIGVQSGDLVEIKTSIPADTIIVNQPAPLLREGMEVKTNG